MDLDIRVPEVDWGKDDERNVFWIINVYDVYIFLPVYYNTRILLFDDLLIDDNNKICFKL